MFKQALEKSAGRTAREKKIRAFAKANGWTVEIHDPGLSVIFKKSRLSGSRVL
jgi:hypothetical protein